MQEKKKYKQILATNEKLIQKKSSYKGKLNANGIICVWIEYARKKELQA